MHSTVRIRLFLVKESIDISGESVYPSPIIIRGQGASRIDPGWRFKMDGNIRTKR